MLGLGEALIAIHHARLIHRDLKPSNIILAPDGPRVIDFGIARAIDNLRITAYGTMIGTPEYMSPEQARGDTDLTPASDVFALGAVLVFASSGHPPFYGSHHFALLNNITYAAPDLDGVPHTLAPIVAACLEKDPANRPRLATLLNTTASSQTPPQASTRLPPRPLVAPTILTAEQAGLRRTTIRRSLLGLGLDHNEHGRPPDALADPGGENERVVPVGHRVRDGDGDGRAGRSVGGELP